MSIDPTQRPVPNPFSNPFADGGFAPELNDPFTTKTNGPHRIKFSGSGAEYFGIWIVNLLLIVITAGIYSPWAKVRREKYFHQHTQIAGSSLDYHGNPISILIGRVLTLGLIALTTSNQINLNLAIGAGLFLAAMLPFAMQRSIRFRLFNTSYRGLRFGFHGSVGQAYSISWLIVLFGLAAFIAPAWINESNKQNLWILGLAYFGLFIAYPFFHAAWRRYTISHAQYGSVNTQAKFTTANFLMVYIKSGLLLVVVPAALMIGGLLFFFWTNQGKLFAVYTSMFLTIPLGFILYACILSYAPLVGARLQNLCWHENTIVTDQHGSQIADFTSDLNVKNFVALQLKNQILTVLTLGLYRPYAAIASARMRLEAISISSLAFVDDVAARAGSQKSAVGDQALDAIGLDFSL